MRPTLATSAAILLLASSSLATSGQKEPEEPARATHDSCQGIRLRASIGKLQYFVNESIPVTILIQNNSDHPDSSAPRYGEFGGDVRTVGTGALGKTLDRLVSVEEWEAAGQNRPRPPKQRL